MLDHADNIAAVFADTMLAGREVVALAPATGETGFTYALRCAPDEVLSVWHTARAVVEATGRWPVVMCSWEGGYPDDDWLSHLAADRARALEERARWGSAPPQAPSELPDLADVLAYLDRHPYTEQYWDSKIDTELAVTARDFGSAPTADEVRAALGDRRSEAELDRWLLDWELARVAEGASMPAASDGHLNPFFPPEPCAVLLLPSAVAWEARAALAFFGISRREQLAAVLRSWNERFGAELMANWDTMLEFVVDRPPATIDEAWQLAHEQTLVARSTIAAPVVALRRHAQALIGRPAWFLHERP